MLYAVTNRHLYGANQADTRERLLEQAAIWAANGVAYVQLREKDLPARDQVELARAMLREIRSAQPPHASCSMKLLVNSRPDVALAAEADGVHLPGGPEALSPDDVRKIFAAAGRTQLPSISVSCHTLSEVEVARKQRPDCVLFSPVFEKSILAIGKQDAQILPGTGLMLLEEACQLASPVPVFALGGVTVENAAQCLRAGATGIAAIRLMQQPAEEWRQLA